MESKYKELNFYGDFKTMLRLAFVDDKITSQELKEKEKELIELADRELKLLDDKSKFIHSVGKLLEFEM